MLSMWLLGPRWLSKPEEWLREIVTKPNNETEAEAKLAKEVFAVAVDSRDDLDEVLEKYSYR